MDKIDNNDIFNPNFLDVVRTTLDKYCTNGKRLTRAELCKKLGLGDEMDQMMSILVNQKFLPGYSISKNSGIGKESDSKESGPVLEADFLTALNQALVKLIPGGGAVKRSELAQEMGMPGSDTEAKISAAFKKSLCPGYVCNRGSGIRKG